MKRQCYCLNLFNRHLQGIASGYGLGQALPDVPHDATGPLPDFMTFDTRGLGYSYDEDDDRFISEMVFMSPPVVSPLGTYRYVVSYVRSTNRETAIPDYIFGVVLCGSDGSMSEVLSSSNTSFTDGIGITGKRYTAILYGYGKSQYKWKDITATIPTINSSVYNLIVGAKSNSTFSLAMQSIGSPAYVSKCFSFKECHVQYSTEPLTWLSSDLTPQVQEILTKARSFKGYAYWFGGAGQVANVALAQQLRKQYKTVGNYDWNLMMADINAGKRVSDCSYLVNFCYNRASPGNHGYGTGNYLSQFSTWRGGGGGGGTPRAGMIAWRDGHTGIIAETSDDPIVIQMSSFESDYVEVRWSAMRNKFTRVLYDPNVKY